MWLSWVWPRARALTPPPPSPPCRAKRTQDNGTVLLKLQNVEDKPATQFYAGKRVCYIYKADSVKNGAKFRTIWGRIGNPHGANGQVKAKFATNLPGKALGAPVRIMLYPSKV